MTRKLALLIVVCGCLLALSHIEEVKGQFCAPPYPHAHAFSSRAANAPKAPSLCGRDESVVFSCVMRSNQKLLSVCSPKKLDANHGYVQFKDAKKASDPT